MSEKNKDVAIKESLIKNLFVIVLCFLFYPRILSSLNNLPTEAVNDFLLILSIFIVTVSFANFAFTYEKTRPSSLNSRLLAHSATFLFLLLTGLLLESMVVVIGIVYPSIYGISIVFSLLLYISIVLYDMWDISRIS